MINAPSGGAPKKAPGWDLTGTEGCGGGIRFLAPYLVVWGYVDIYRRKKYVGGATRGPRGWGRAWGGGQVRPPTSWPPVNWLDVGSKSPELYSARKSRSRRFHSVWTPLIFLFFETLKQAKNNNSGLGLRLIG